MCYHVYLLRSGKWASVFCLRTLQTGGHKDHSYDAGYAIDVLDFLTGEKWSNQDIITYFSYFPVFRDSPYVRNQLFQKLKELHTNPQTQTFAKLHLKSMFPGESFL